jgi:hypothetical protein
MQFTLIWPPGEAELNGDVVDAARAIGAHGDDLTELRAQLPADATLVVRPGSMGVGASGPALAIVIEVERFAGDTASLIAIGGLLWGLIKKLKAKRRYEPLTEDPTTMAALGAEPLSKRLRGARYLYTVPVKASPGVGTDRRDVWAAVFIDGKEHDGNVLLLLLSPSGRCLGLLNVETEFFFDGTQWVERTDPTTTLL